MEQVQGIVSCYAPLGSFIKNSGPSCPQLGAGQPDLMVCFPFAWMPCTAYRTQADRASAPTRHSALHLLQREPCLGLGLSCQIALMLGAHSVAPCRHRGSLPAAPSVLRIQAAGAAARPDLFLGPSRDSIAPHEQEKPPQQTGSLTTACRRLAAAACRATARQPSC